MVAKHCPTCPGARLRDFVPLTPGELALAAARPDVAPGTAERYKRCSNDGCRRVQRHFAGSRGFRLPEELSWPKRG
ncbi:hypothetical protein G3I40_04590 [Streptomyces sp. SID14478]|uniref:hypothetical protein n=1 Tax=Streptomyces sp. SID14478 TaxID=2706073 RepID=UPI0013DAE052|nr:hypothetical protein [Streptomyces sp. SID14478]NEB74512.1 hypothetical protein [Streptomyces sp. SID14478]